MFVNNFLRIQLGSVTMFLCIFTLHSISNICSSTYVFFYLGLDLKNNLINLNSILLNSPIFNSFYYYVCLFIFFFKQSIACNYKLCIGIFLVFVKFTSLIHLLNCDCTINALIVNLHNPLLDNAINLIHPVLTFLTISHLLFILWINSSYLNLYLKFNTPPHLHVKSNRLLFARNYDFLFWNIVNLITLILGAWWAMQTGTWEGWWAWDESEINLLFIACLTTIVIHFKHTKNNLFIKLPTLQVFVLVFLTHQVFVQIELLSTLHSFFNVKSLTFEVVSKLNLKIKIIIGLLLLTYIAHYRKIIFNKFSVKSIPCKSTFYFYSIGLSLLTLIILYNISTKQWPPYTIFFFNFLIINYTIFKIFYIKVIDKITLKIIHLLTLVVLFSSCFTRDFTFISWIISGNFFELTYVNLTSSHFDLYITQNIYINEFFTLVKQYTAFSLLSNFELNKITYNLSISIWGIHENLRLYLPIYNDFFSVLSWILIIIIND